MGDAVVLHVSSDPDFVEVPVVALAAVVVVFVAQVVAGGAELVVPSGGVADFAAAAVLAPVAVGQFQLLYSYQIPNPLQLELDHL